jgi:HPt (histidine-containing phosphotransfer) domain-containing protein
MARRDLTGAVDFAYLEGFAAGDTDVVSEVLNLFLQQADIWERLLDATSEGWKDALHTIKGASRGIGAFDLGQICEMAESSRKPDLDAVKDSLNLVRMDIAAYTHEQALKSLKG